MNESYHTDTSANFENLLTEKHQDLPKSPESASPNRRLHTESLVV